MQTKSTKDESSHFLCVRTHPLTHSSQRDIIVAVAMDCITYATDETGALGLKILSLLSASTYNSCVDKRRHTGVYPVTPTLAPEPLQGSR